MRKFLLITFLVPLIFACNNEETGTKITGAAANLEDGFFILGGSAGAKDSIFLEEDGSFEFDLGDLTKPESYYILSGNDFLRFQVAPEQIVDIYFDKEDFKGSVNFGGDGEDKNNFLADKNRETSFAGPENDNYLLEPVAFVEWAKGNLDAQNAFLVSYEKNDATDVFWKIQEADILYGWAQLMDNYPMYHKYYAEKEELELPEGYDSYKADLDLNNEDYLGSQAFNGFVNGAVSKAASLKTAGQEDPDRNMANVLAAKDLITNQKVLNTYWTSYIKGQMSWTPLSELDGAIAFVRENCTDVDMLAEIDSEYNAWMKLAEGQPGFDFVGKDLEGNEVKFSDFKGKYVYVDVWATWCGPCKYEIPFLKTLEADYHGRNIVFMSYSIDDDKQAWLDFVPENELGGVQIIGENAWESAMPVYYKVRGVPTFMFFGPDGNIIDVKMTRPSNQATRDKFDSYSDL